MTDPAYLAQVEAAGYTVLRDPAQITLDPAASRLLPLDAAGVGLQVSGDVLLVAVASVPTPAQAVRFERAAAMPVTFAIVDHTVLEQLHQVVAARRPGDGPRILAAALAHAEKAQATDLTLVPGRVPHAKVGQATAPLKGFARLAPADIDDAAKWLLGDVNTPSWDDVVTVGDSRWRIHAGLARGRRTLGLRRLPASPPKLGDLALPAALGEAANANHGLILIASGAGGGRTSTAAAVVDRINSSRALTIVTVENPVEFQHRSRTAHVIQQQVFADVHDVSSGVAAAASYGADVLQLDVTDPASARHALNEAAAGRLVIATIAATGAPAALRRLVGFVPPDEQEAARADLAATLRAVSAQQLVTSTSGPLAVCEVIAGTAGARSIIRDGRWNELASLFDSDAQAIAMDRSLALYVASGRVSAEVARASAVDQAQFDTFLAHTPASSTPTKARTRERAGASESVTLPDELPAVKTESRRGRLARGK